MSDLKSHLSQYLRRVRSGEAFQVTSRGEVVAELRPPAANRDVTIPAGLRELVRRGIASKVVRNNSSSYRRFEPLLSNTTTQELLDQDRGDR